VADRLLNIIDPSFFVELGGEGENKGKSHDGSYDNLRDRTQETSYHPKWPDLPIIIRCAPRQLYSYSFFSSFDFSPFRRKTIPNYLQLTIEKILSGDMNFLFLFKVPQFSWLSMQTRLSATNQKKGKNINLKEKKNRSGIQLIFNPRSSAALISYSNFPVKAHRQLDSDEIPWEKKREIDWEKRTKYVFVTSKQVERFQHLPWLVFFLPRFTS
jgi:hypothetical protein